MSYQNKITSAKNAVRRAQSNEARAATLSRCVISRSGSATEPYGVSAVDGTGAVLGEEFRLWGWPQHTGSLLVGTQVAVALAGANGEPVVLEGLGGGGGGGDFVIAESLGFAS
jgi:hypothetical protein